MIKISNLKLNPGEDMGRLKRKAARLLKIPDSYIQSIRILKKSIDARKREQIKILYTICVTVRREEEILRRVQSKEITPYQEEPYHCPEHGTEKLKNRPVVVGMGPCGLFCAYLLAKEGYHPLLIERGDDVDKRKEKTEQFFKSGTLDTESNVQFGEGGAGTFSDGKLNTQVKDPSGRIRYVLETFVKNGAKEEILYDSKPHVGTDVLSVIVKKMREEIIANGGEVRFRTKMTGLFTENGRVSAIEVNGEETIAVSALVLAIGHSARDTFRMLFSKGLNMEAKSFAVGFRVQHPQAVINELLYGNQHPSPALGPAPYKVTAKTASGRGVYSFCMCPGGYVVNASSEPYRTAVNGMSYSGRDGRNANSAIIVAVTPEDFKKETGRDDPLCGIAFQEKLEERAYQAGQGDVPVQLFGDFKKGIKSTSFGKVTPAIKGNYRLSSLNKIFPKEINDSFIEGMHHFGYNLEGFDDPDTLLCAVESRTSSPVRIVRDAMGLGNIEGIYPAGEGAGYAGGITSAAVDGIKTAEKIIMRYDNDEL